MSEVNSTVGRPSWLGLALLFALALLPRCLAVSQYEAEHPNANAPVIDERSYDAWAREIAAGDWIGDEVFFQEPLYPYFLGAIYSVSGTDNGRHAARIVQCLLGALACVFTTLCARQLFGGAAGWLAGAMLAATNTAIMFPSYLLKPNLFVPLAAFLAWFVLRVSEQDSKARARWITLGVACGLGALLRGNMLILLPAFAALIAWGIRRATAVGLFVSGLLVVLLPVAIRNYAVGDVFALTTSGAGTNLYGGNNADNPYGTAREFDWVRGIPEFEAADWRHEAERRTGRELDAGEVSRYWIGELGASFANDPLMHVGILGNKLRATLSDYEVPDNHDLEWDARYVSLLRAPLASWGLLGPLILAGFLCALFKPKSKRERLLAVLFLAYLATIVLTVTSMRVRLALLPLGLPLAAGLCVRIGEDWRSKRVGLWLGALLACVVVVHGIGPFDAAERARRLETRDYNLATQLLEEGRDLDRAKEIADALRERHPRSARTLSLWAELEARGGLEQLGQGGNARLEGQERIRAALGTLRTLAEKESLSSKERFRARRLAAWIQLSIENGAAAASHFRIALEFDREDPELWLGYIQASLLMLPSCLPEERELLRQEILRAIEAHLDADSPAAIDLARRARE